MACEKENTREKRENSGMRETGENGETRSLIILLASRNN
jgi:hypothetical protein